MRSCFSIVVFAIVVIAVAGQSLAAEGWQVKQRKQSSVKEGEFKVTEETVAWDPARTAIIIVDMWNNHSCKSAAQRVVEMAPHMNRALVAARDKGVLIIHAPSNCMAAYRDTPARKLAQSAPFAAAKVKFQWNYFDSKREGPLEPKLEQAGCSCDSAESCPGKPNWTKEIETLEIKDGDAVSDDGQEIHNLLTLREIENVILMGVHTNRCVLGRPFGIRQMVYMDRNVVLCRDLTDSFHRDPGHHFAGLQKIIEHVERFWCPTISSESITGDTPFTFAARDESAG
jgi:nicotinamidase-related amidase